MKKCSVLLFLFSALLLASCSKKSDEIELKPMALEDLSPRIEWALVCDPYVACREKADYESPSIASLRKGEIYQVEGNCTIKIGEGKNEKKETWYAIQNGWVPGSAVRIFSNRLRAEEALKTLK